MVKATDFVEWLQIKISNSDKLLNIVNIYNLPGRADEPRLSKWRQIKLILEVTASGRTLLVGDFNAYHPEWAGVAIEREPKADYLLTRMAGIDFQLLNEPGETI